MSQSGPPPNVRHWAQAEVTIDCVELRIVIFARCLGQNIAGKRAVRDTGAADGMRSYLPICAGLGRSASIKGHLSSGTYGNRSKN